MDKLTKNWHKSIKSVAEAKLGRDLTDVEAKFITAREAYIALEVIEDSVNSLSVPELEGYLNSEYISEH